MDKIVKISTMQFGLKQNKGITNIMIAISDVSFFIEKNDPLDLEAKKEVIHFIFLTELFQCFPMKFQMTYAR